MNALLHQNRRPAISAGRAAPRQPARLATTTAIAVKPAAAAAVTAVTAAAAAALVLSTPSAAQAAGGELLGEFAASGILFKDSVQVSRLEDRDLPGVTVYVSDFKRSITDKLSKDFFSEPSQASLTCVLSGAASSSTSPLSQETTESLGRRLGGSGGSGVEVFAERKGLNLLRDKTLRVRRLFDPAQRTAVYVAYSTRLGTAGDEGGVSTGRYRTSICAVPLPAYAGGAAVAGEQQQ